MSLQIIGIGLRRPEDITVAGLRAVKEADVVYLEDYTSLLACRQQELEIFYGKKVVLANRETTEQGAEKLVVLAKKSKVVFLVIGDPFSATTHIELYRLAKEEGVEVMVIHNASVLTAVGIVGLELYKYGKVTSIPFLDDFPTLVSPYRVIEQNKSLGYHTLCLLDIKKEANRFMTVAQALDTLYTIEKREQKNLLDEDTLFVGCARLGDTDAVVAVGSRADLASIDFGAAPHCLIIPGTLHFMEEEMLATYKIVRE